MLFRNIISEVIRPDFFDFFCLWAHIMFPVWYRVVFCRDHESEMKWKSSFCQKSGLFYEVFLFDVPFISTLCWIQLFERLNLICSYLSVNKWNFYFFVGSNAVNAGSWMIKMSSLNDNWIPRLFEWFQNEIGMGLDHEKLMRLKSRLSGVGTPHSFRNFMTKIHFEIQSLEMRLKFGIEDMAWVQPQNMTMAKIFSYLLQFPLRWPDQALFGHQLLGVP